MREWRNGRRTCLRSKRGSLVEVQVLSRAHKNWEDTQVFSKIKTAVYAVFYYLFNH